MSRLSTFTTRALSAQFLKPTLVLLATLAVGGAWAAGWWQSGTEWSSVVWDGNSNEYFFAPWSDLSLSFSGACKADSNVRIGNNDYNSENGHTITFSAASNSESDGLSITGSLNVGENGDQGILNIKSGRYTASTGLFVSGGSSRYGSLIMDGGYLDITGEVQFGNVENSICTNYINAGATIANNNFFCVGRAAGTDTYLEVNGGTVQTTGTLTIGTCGSEASKGVMVVKSGTVTANYINVGEFDTAILTISGGNVTGTAGVTLADAAPDNNRAWNTEGFTANEKATLNLDGGVLTAPSIVRGNGAGSGNTYVNFNGGTLAASAAGTLVGSGLTVTVDTNGGTIDTNSKSVTIVPAITGSGTLRIVGGGSVDFTTAPTCTVTVNSGTTVSGISAVASVADASGNVTYYQSLDDAIAAASADYPAVLLADATWYPTALGTFYIDAGSYTLTVGGVTYTAEGTVYTVTALDPFYWTGTTDTTWSTVSNWALDSGKTITAVRPPALNDAAHITAAATVNADDAAVGTLDITTSGDVTLTGALDLPGAFDVNGANGTVYYNATVENDIDTADLNIGYHAGSSKDTTSSSFILNGGTLVRDEVRVGYNAYNSDRLNRGYLTIKGGELKSRAIRLGPVVYGTADLTVNGGSVSTEVLEVGNHDMTANVNATAGIIDVTGAGDALKVANYNHRNNNSYGNVNISGSAKLFVTNGNTLVSVNHSSGQTVVGTINQTGGTAKFKTMYLANASDVNGYYNHSSGDAEFDTLYVGYRSGSTGTVAISGEANMTITNVLRVGETGTGIINQTGGALTAKRLLTSTASGHTGVGTINVASGTFTVGQSDSILGDKGASEFNQTGGDVTFQKKLTLANAEGYAATYNLEGGTFTVRELAAGNGTAALNYKGGTIKTTTTGKNFVLAGVSQYVFEGGAIFDTDEYVVTNQGAIATGYTDSTIDGGLTKRGSGTLAITVTPSYTGPTVVEAGQLVLPGVGATSGFKVYANETVPPLVFSGATSLDGVAISLDLDTLTESKTIKVYDVENVTGTPTITFVNPSSTGTYAYDTTTTPGSVIVTYSIADTFTWTGNGSDGSWNTIANWVDSNSGTTRYPTSVDSAIVSKTATISASDASVENLAFQGGSYNSGEHFVLNGTVAVSGTFDHSYGILDVNVSSLTVDTWINGGWYYKSQWYSSNAIPTRIMGGTIDITTFNNGYNFEKYRGTRYDAGVLDINGGTTTITTFNNANCFAGQAVVNVNSGKLTVETFYNGFRYNSNTSVGRVYVNGGELDVTTLNLGKDVGATGNLTLSGGTVKAQSIVNGSGTANLYLNGGTLAPIAANANWIASGVAAYVQSGGAVVLNDVDVTIAATLAEDSESVGGGFTKKGAGTLTLSQAPAYTGATTVEAGTLVIGGAFNTSSTAIVPGATLKVLEPSGTPTVSGGGLYEVAVATDGDYTVYTVVASAESIAVNGAPANIVVDVDDLASVGITAGMTDAQKSAALEATAANGLAVWQNYVMNINATQKFAAVVTPTTETDMTVATSFGSVAGRTGAGVTVTYKLMKKSGNEWVQVDESTKPSFSVDPSDLFDPSTLDANARLKIQAVFQ